MTGVGPVVGSGVKVVGAAGDGVRAGGAVRAGGHGWGLRGAERLPDGLWVVRGPRVGGEGCEAACGLCAAGWCWRCRVRCLRLGGVRHGGKIT